MINTQGEVHSLLLVAGSNSGGQLGLGSREDSHIFLPARCRAAASATSTTTTTSTFPPNGTQLIQLSSGANHSLALLERYDETGTMLAQEVWATGENGQGQLGSLQARSAETPGEVWLPLDWEANLGLTSLLTSHDRHDTYSLASVMCGWQTSYLVLRPANRQNDDLIVALGTNNDFGELGLVRGNATSAASNLVPLRHAFPAGMTGTLRVSSIAAGLRHVSVLCLIEEKEDAALGSLVLVGWGASRHGQVGSVVSEGVVNSASPSNVAWGPQLMERWDSVADSFELDTKRCRSQVVAGKAHTVALLSLRADASSDAAAKTSFLHVWGSNRRNQCQLASSPFELGSVAVPLQLTSNWDTTLTLCRSPGSDKIRIIGSGNNAKAQLGNSINDKRAIQEVRFPGERTFNVDGAKLASGSEHSLLLVEGEVWGWGWNEHGTLGTEPGAAARVEEEEEEVDHRLPSLLWQSALNEGYKAMNVWAGCGTSFILLEREKS